MDPQRQSTLEFLGTKVPIPGPLPTRLEKRKKHDETKKFKLKDGRVLMPNIDGAPRIPSTIRFAGEELWEQEKIASKSGYKLIPSEKEYVTGPRKVKLLDGTAWAAEANKHVKSKASNMPEVPFAWMFCGAMGSGKSTWLGNILSFYVHKDCFREAHVFSPTCRIDPTLWDAVYERDPNCTIHLHENYDPDLIAKKSEEIEILFAPYLQKAMRGKFTKKEKTAENNEFMREFDDPSHPYVTLDGRYHGHDPIVEIRSATRRQERVPRKDRQRDRAELAVLLSRPIMDGAEKRLLNFMSQKTKFDPNAPIPADGNAHEYPKLLALNNLDHTTLDARRRLHEKALADPAGSIDLNKKRAVLFAFDDATGTIHGPFGAALSRFITRVRHYNMSILMMVHQPRGRNGIPTVMRDVITHVSLAATRKPRALKVLEEEFGQDFPNFKSLMHAATCILPGREKDFLQLDLKAGRAFRGTAGELVSLGPKEVKEYEGYPEQQSESEDGLQDNSDMDSLSTDEDDDDFDAQNDFSSTVQEKRDEKKPKSRKGHSKKLNASSMVSAKGGKLRKKKKSKKV